AGARFRPFALPLAAHRGETSALVQARRPGPQLPGDAVRRHLELLDLEGARHRVAGRAGEGAGEADQLARLLPRPAVLAAPPEVVVGAHESLAAQVDQQVGLELARADG